MKNPFPLFAYGTILHERLILHISGSLSECNVLTFNAVMQDSDKRKTRSFGSFFYDIIRD